LIGRSKSSLLATALPLKLAMDREPGDMASRKTFLKFYTGDHKRLGDPTSAGAFYAVQTVIHTTRAEDGPM
jgi:hypothetical protein